MPPSSIKPRLHPPSWALALLMASAVLAAPGIGAQQASSAFVLITPAEAMRDFEVRAKSEAQALPEARTRGVPGIGGVAGGPVFAIRVLAPSAQGTVSPPLRIEVVFEPLPGAKVVPSSFRVLYGVLKLDLTERLRRFATISENGVVVDRAVVPEGLHRLVLQVADDRGNVAEQEVRFRVGATS